MQARKLRAIAFMAAPSVIVARSEDAPAVRKQLGHDPAAPVGSAMTSQHGERLPPGTRVPQRRCPTVLLVDDELLIRASLGQFLERAGYAVIAVADPDTAIRHLRKSAIDAVILDIRLAGGRSGLEVLERIRLDDTDLPVIVLTGVCKLGPADEALIHRQHADLFYKPEACSRLIQRLSTLIGQTA